MSSQDPASYPTPLKSRNHPISPFNLTLKISFESSNHDEEFSDGVSNEWLNSVIKYRSYCLCDPVENLSFCKAFPLFFGLLNLIMHVTHLAIDHNDAQVALLISKRVFIRHDIDVS